MRKDKIIGMVRTYLADAAMAADTAGSPRRLSIAAWEAVADLDHAMSDAPCNHGACKGTALADGSPAHVDERNALKRNVGICPYCKADTVVLGSMSYECRSCFSAWC